MGADAVNLVAEAVWFVGFSMLAIYLFVGDDTL